MSEPIDPCSTALILVDLQHSNLARELAPHPAERVLERCVRLADAWRATGATIVFVRVDVSEIRAHTADRPIPRPATIPPQASQLVPGVNIQPGDVLITKRQWGAFHGTELDQVLRRRGVTTLVLGGIATNFGVESTARAALDRGYNVVFAEDAMSTMSAEMHRFAVEGLFPLMGRVRSTAQLLELAVRTATP
jgi:nicotinamidase-related amidase